MEFRDLILTRGDSNIVVLGLRALDTFTPKASSFLASGMSQATCRKGHWGWGGEEEGADTFPQRADQTFTLARTDGVAELRVAK